MPDSTTVTIYVNVYFTDGASPQGFRTEAEANAAAYAPRVQNRALPVTLKRDDLQAWFAASS